jgi:hypothetical protein
MSREEQCSSFKKSCDSEHDPISMVDWCDIDPKNYIPKGKIGSGQCYELTTMIRWIEQTISRSGKAIDPLTNLPLPRDQVQYLADEHEKNGNQLSSVIANYIGRPRAQAAQAAQAHDMIRSMNTFGLFVQAVGRGLPPQMLIQLPNPSPSRNRQDNRYRQIYPELVERGVTTIGDLQSYLEEIRMPRIQHINMFWRCLTTEQRDSIVSGNV